MDENKTILENQRLVEKVRLKKVASSPQTFRKAVPKLNFSFRYRQLSGLLKVDLVKEIHW